MLGLGLGFRARSSRARTVAPLVGVGTAVASEPADTGGVDLLSGVRNASTCATKVSGEIGLGIYPSNPAARTLSRSPTMANAVTATKGVLRSSLSALS